VVIAIRFSNSFSIPPLEPHIPKVKLISCTDISVVLGLRNLEADAADCNNDDKKSSAADCTKSYPSIETVDSGTEFSTSRVKALVSII